MTARRYRDNSIFRRIFKALVSVVILSSFILMITFAVKGVANFDPIRFAKFTKPFLAKLNIDEDRAGEVAGQFVKRISETGISKDADGNDINMTNGDSNGDIASGESTILNGEDGRTLEYRLALMSDSEGDFENLEQALEKAKDLNAKKVLFLGDLSAFGEMDGLNEGKSVLEDSGLEYFIIPGDHDLAASDPAGDKNFKKVFDRTHQVVRVGDYKFVMFDNSKNFTPLTEQDFEWLDREIDDADIVILSQPLYHESINVVMGVVDGADIPGIKEQAEELLNMIRGFDVKTVISGDQHNFSVSDDPVKDGLTHYVIGALLSAGVRNPSGTNFAVFDIFDDGSFKISKVDL
jgi:predicted phosphodiesterase